MVEGKIKQIIWSSDAEKQFFTVLEYLDQEAPHAINIVGGEIKEIINGLVTHFNHYPIDRFKINNDGSYRAALVYNYRISYKIEDSYIYILRIRHASREPLLF